MTEAAGSKRTPRRPTVSDREFQAVDLPGRPSGPRRAERPGHSLWGWLLWTPLVAAEAKLRAARNLARRRVVAHIEERHAAEAGRTASELPHPA
ncbi:hypothetical protein ABZ920_00745 [Streptomyces sp. NPDC046831]|uniref:hypothetical protein n=1 Tax=Streptomyces sp. NPDC046831 TaxID=3154805 RepID=UPI0033CAD783